MEYSRSYFVALLFFSKNDNINRAHFIKLKYLQYTIHVLGLKHNVWTTHKVLKLYFDIVYVHYEVTVLRHQ